MSGNNLFNNVDRIRQLAESLVTEIEKDVEARLRDEIISELRGKLFDAGFMRVEPKENSELLPLPIQTDLHGEPVAGSESATPMPIYGRNHPKSDPDFWKNYQRPMSKKHREMVSILSRGRFVALPTIAGLVKLKASTVQQYLYDLADHGYEIESKTVNVRYGKTGYRKIYRIASGS